LKVTLAPEAVVDWTSAVEYARARSSAAAATLNDRIHSTIVMLAAGELDGIEQTLRRDGSRVRSWPVPPYRIYYRRCEGDELLVLRVYHGAREPIAR
jgi:plasmid stabilization system protein ParE